MNSEGEKKRENVRHIPLLGIDARYLRYLKQIGERRVGKECRL